MGWKGGGQSCLQGPADVSRSLQQGAKNNCHGCQSARIKLKG